MRLCCSLTLCDWTISSLGQQGWVAPGGYWCQPYHEWYRIYQYLPDARKVWDMDLDPESPRNHVLGSEVLVWAEEIDGSNVEQKVWPRAAALAERFWSDPSPTDETGWFAADHRMQIHRDRMVQRGFGASALQPRWCLQHPGVCTLSASKVDQTATAYHTAGRPREQWVPKSSAIYESDFAGAQRA